MNETCSATLYIAVDGDDRADGDRRHPLRTLVGARDRLRRMRREGVLRGPAEVVLRGGIYELAESLRLSPEDSHTTYRSAEGERAIIDGGVRVTGWTETEHRGVRAWIAELAPLGVRAADLRSLFVGGERRLRPQLPKPTADPRERPFFRMAGSPNEEAKKDGFAGDDAFFAQPGDVKPWDRLHEIDVVALHFWIESRLPIASFDPATGLVTCRYRAGMALRDGHGPEGARYYLDNVADAFGAPGEWYADPRQERLYYLPLTGETVDRTECFVPRLRRLVEVAGDPENGRLVESVAFRGVTFRHTDWLHDGRVRRTIPHLTPKWTEEGMGGSPQGAAHLGGMISFRGTRGAALEGCTIECGGDYGIDAQEACTSLRVIDCTLRNLGGGGIKMSGTDARGPVTLRTGNSVIRGNDIHHVGQVYHSAVGIFLLHSGGNTIAGNHVHDLFYTPVSVGWIWGYEESVSFDNIIEDNHLHDYGLNWLGDLGGVYLLGVSPGTVVRRNLIHDCIAPNYGGAGVYLDQGGAHIVIEDNTCYRFTGPALLIHFGRENIARGNILAHAKGGCVGIGRDDGNHVVTMERNLLVAEDGRFYVGGYAAGLSTLRLSTDRNAFASSSLGVTSVAEDSRGGGEQRFLSLDEWRALGHDEHTPVEALGGDEPAEWTALTARLALRRRATLPAPNTAEMR